MTVYVLLMDDRLLHVFRNLEAAKASVVRRFGQRPALGLARWDSVNGWWWTFTDDDFDEPLFEIRRKVVRNE